MAQQANGLVPLFTSDQKTLESYLDVQRRMALAQALTTSGLTPVDTKNRQIGNVATRISPMEGLGKMAEVFVGQQLQRDAVKSQAQLQADYVRELTDKMTGSGTADTSSAPSSTPAATALALGAANGSVGPTNDNARLLAQVLASQDSGNGAGPSIEDKKDAATLTNSAPVQAPSVGQAGRNSLNPTGISPTVAAQLYMLDPTKYLETVANQSAPTDFQKVAAAAGLAPGSPEYQAAMRGNVAKNNYIAPVSIRPGGALMDPRTGGLTTVPASAPAGFQAVRSPDGSWSYQEVGNGTAAVSQAATAQEIGRAQAEPTMVYDKDTGEWKFSTRAQDIGRAGGAPVNPPTNNFGNIRPPGQSTGFANFSSPQEGLAAIDRNLQAYASKGINTVSGIVSRWAPPNENDTGAYVQAVAQRLGVNPNQPLDMANPVIRQALSTAIILQEQGPGRVFGGSGIVPKPAAGVAEAQTNLANSNAARFNSTLQEASGSPTRVNVLDNILSLSRSGVQTGPTADFMNRVKGYVASLPGAEFVAGNWKDDVSGFQELNKFLYQNAQRNWQAAGGTGTDAQLEAFSKSNPNPTMFPKALQAMAEWAKGGELALQGKANAMQNFRNANPQNIARLDAFEQQWRQSFDPLLFQLRAMDPNAASAYTANLQRTNPVGYRDLMRKAAALRQMGGL